MLGEITKQEQKIIDLESAINTNQEDEEIVDKELIEEYGKVNESLQLYKKTRMIEECLNDNKIVEEDVFSED